MIGRINESFQFHAASLRLRGERQQILAANIANADTPGYKAVDFDFARALADAAGRGARVGAAAIAATAGAPAMAATAGAPALATTAAGHRGGGGGGGLAPTLQVRGASQGSIDGNSVEMDAERAAFADNAVRYEASLRFLNGQIRSLVSAITG